MNKLWSKEIPYNTEELDFVPGIEEYICDGSKTAVVIFPGGGYGGKAEYEGKDIAEWLNQNGITAFVVDYRVAPYRHPAEISDGMRAMKYVRYHADKWGIDKDKIYIMGFSAGAHLAGSVSVHYDKKMYEPTDDIDMVSCRPDGTILCYPVIDMLEYRHDGSRWNLFGGNPPYKMSEFMSLHKQVDENTPKAFIWHTANDGAVPVENSLMYATALSKVQVPFELHIYPDGPHGLGLSDSNEHVAQWKQALINWIRM